MTAAAPYPNTVTIDVVLTVTNVPVIASIRNAATHIDGPVAPASLAQITGGNLAGTAVTTQDGSSIVPDSDGRFGSREVAVESTSPGLFRWVFPTPPQANSTSC